jgi:CheY-like chemotaxis protein
MTPERKIILIVEDEAVVADMLESILQDLGMTVLGPAGTVAAALTLCGSDRIDAAILDVNLRGEKIDPVADALRRRGVPMVFATGYGAGAAATAKGAPIITKPYTRERVASALSVCFTR